MNILDMKIFFKNTFFSITFLMLLYPLMGQEELKDWHEQGTGGQFTTGIGSQDWYSTQAPGKSRKVIVAIIDSGVDTEHPDLKDNIWINPREIPGNHKDDDGNGYVDDINGWNFLGGKDGSSVIKESLEVTRLYGQEKAKWENVDPTKLKGKKKKEYDEYLEMKDTVESKLEKSKDHIEQINKMQAIVISSLNAAKAELNGDTLDVARLEKSDKEEVKTAAKIIRNVEDQGIKVESIDWLIEIANDQFATQTKADSDNINYSYNPDYNARIIVGDTYNDFTNTHYGNNNVHGDFAFHGTHVSGIIGAVRNNGIGMNGIADNVALMSNTYSEPVAVGRTMYCSPARRGGSPAAPAPAAPPTPPAGPGTSRGSHGPVVDCGRVPLVPQPGGELGAQPGVLAQPRDVRDVLERRRLEPLAAAVGWKTRSRYPA